LNWRNPSIGERGAWGLETIIAAALLAACGQGAEPEPRRIVPHALSGCHVAANETLVFTALGDFGGTYAASIGDLAVNRELSLPRTLLGVESASFPPGYRGVGYGGPPDDVHLTIWRTSDACDALPFDLPTESGSLVPPSQGGTAMTAFANGGAVMVAGLDPPAGAAVNSSAFALAWSAGTGERLAPIGMGAHRRAFASATEFGEGALVAGGVDTKYLPGRPVDSALVFRDGGFQEPPIILGDARARHGAVVLGDGETLLVGGEGDDGRAMASFVAIAPGTGSDLGQARIFGLGALARARKSPTLLRLANDRILVAGGVDDAGQPVTSLEWFEESGAPCTQGNSPCSTDPPWSPWANRAFVALAGGSALAAGGVDPVTGQLETDVWWITPEGDALSLAPLSPSQRGSAKVLRLVAGADQSPWLWNGDAWIRFDPWQGSFVVPDAAPDDGPDDDLPAPVAVDPGLFMWLRRSTAGDSSARLRGFRHGVRGPFARDLAPLIFADTVHVAPDRPPGPTGEIYFDGEWLQLKSDGPRSPGVVVTDTLYGDFDLSVQASGDALPLLDIGKLALGSTACPWPSAAPTSGATSTVSVRRKGRSLDVQVDARASGRNCESPDGRVGIAIRAPEGARVAVRKLSVLRQ